MNCKGLLVVMLPTLHIVRRKYTILTALPVHPTLCNMALRYGFTIFLVLVACPVWAGERVQAVADELNFDEPFEQAAAKSALRSLLNQALDSIENHIQLTWNLRPNQQTGEQQGHLQLKLYPQGKSQSDDHISAELQFRSSSDGQHLSFDLKGPKESSSSPFSSPDNAL